MKFFFFINMTKKAKKGAKICPKNKKLTGQDHKV